MAGRARVAVLVMMVAALSGCMSSSGDSGQVETSQAPLSAAPGQFDDQSGALSGIVMDPELVPIVNAQLNLVGTSFFATSAADGTFSMSKVPPGDHVLAAAKLGYEAAAQRVTVEAGSVRENVRLILAPLAVVEARIEVEHFNGYITCTVGHALVLSEECGQGVVTQYGTFGANPNNKIDWKFNLTDKTLLEDILLEMDWKPGSAAANKLTLYVGHKFSCDPSCGVDRDAGGKVHCSTSNYGPPVMRCHIPADDITVKDPAKDLPYDFTSRAWGAQVGLTEVPNIVFEQSFKMYKSEFYGEPMSEGYTAVADN